MGGDLLDLLVLLGEPAEPLHRLRHRGQAPGLHDQGLDEGEQGRGGLAARPPDHLVGRRLLVHPFKGRPGLGDHLRGLRERQLGRAVGVDVLEYDAVVPDQGPGDLPLGGPDLLQLRPGLLDLRGDALAEHRRQVADATGIPLAATLTGGNRNDVTQLNTAPPGRAAGARRARPAPVPPGCGAG
jgi:hypothetical protein